MQVTISGSAAPAFNLTKLQTAFKHNASGTGVFESGQHPIIVGQAAYNSAYGTGFAASSNCNAPGSTLQRCDGLVRVNDTSTFGFNTLKAPAVKMTIPLQPKALHDEMNSSTFDEYGRMQANIGVEAQPPSPGQQNVTLYPFVNPATELINGTNLPTPTITYDANGLPASEIKITPISDAGDGTQIWRITHNGVDTHPIHFHLYDVQVINRVTWDNIILPPDATELGWKDTVRISPLEDTIVALRPIIPKVPFEVPNAIRMLNPMMPAGATAMFNNVDPQGNPTNPITNQLVNFGWEYVYHCHILSHEEMDMMRPVSLALPPAKASGLAFTSTGTGNNRRLIINWNDNSINETAFVIQSKNADGTWSNVGTPVLSPLDQPNTHGPRTFTVPGTYNPNTIYVYRIIAQNTVGYGAEFPSMTVQSISDPLIVGNPPVAPTNLTATLQAGPQISLAWTDNALNESGFVIERSINGGGYLQIGTAPARNNTGGVTFIDKALALSPTNDTYAYRVAAVNLAGPSAYVGSAPIVVPGTPANPSNLTLSSGANSGNSRSVILTWNDNSTNETGFTIQRATNSSFTGNSVTSVTVAANLTATASYTWTGLSRNTVYYFRVRANNGTIIFSGWTTAASITTNP
jgi:Multicopper oxidase